MLDPILTLVGVSPLLGKWRHECVSDGRNHNSHPTQEGYGPIVRDRSERTDLTKGVGRRRKDVGNRSERREFIESHGVSR